MTCFLYQSFLFLLYLIYRIFTDNSYLRGFGLYFVWTIYSLNQYYHLNKNMFNSLYKKNYFNLNRRLYFFILSRSVGSPHKI